MKVNLSKAVKYFFANPSLEMVYFEAIANAIDAKATDIHLSISIDSFAKNETLRVEITDNGEGFTDENFDRFKSLLDVEDDAHKGVGRLVFLNYFDSIEVSSGFGTSKRSFEFTGEFDGENQLIQRTSGANQTSLVFKKYKKEKIKTYDYLRPESIRKAILQHFFPLLYSLKVEKRSLKVTVTLKTKENNVDQGFYTDTRVLDVKEIPEMKLESFAAEGLDLFEKLDLYFSIKATTEESTPITALCVDGRTYHVEILSKSGIPFGHEIIFLLYSNLFTGKSNASRQELNFGDAELKTIKKLFGQKVNELLTKEIPAIQEQNEKITQSLHDRFPHLIGFFESNAVGIIDRNAALETAQARFFQAQKETLDSIVLSDEQFIKSLEISSRLLTEYILYRNIIIGKLRKIDAESNESVIHNIIVPMKKVFKKETLFRDIYNNNAWLLDDKYMAYTTILSDADMNTVLKEILIDNESLDNDDTRPDIALVFSSDPRKANTKLDVVIVELKKLGLGLAKKEELISQLRQRARKLLKYYGSRIQRIWFYGIVDFDLDFVRSLKEDDFLEVFSNDKYFYKELKIMPDYDESIKIPTGVNVLSFEAFFKDAEARNETFLNLLKRRNEKPRELT